MSSATDKTVTVEFNPTATSKQADVISGATTSKAGVMTAEQVQLLLAASGGGSGPAPALTQILYVNKGGNDATGDGSITKPFLTIQAATSSVTDASTLKRYAILVGPGRFDEPVVIKPWVFIVGTDTNGTRIGGAVTIGPEWNTPAGPLSDARGGFSTCTLAGSVTIDFNAVSSNEGKFLANNAVFNQAPVFTAFSAINQVVLSDVRMFAGYTQNGINMTLNAVYVQGGNITVNSINDGRNLPTFVSAFGGGAVGALTATWGTSLGSNAITLLLNSFPVNGLLTLDGLQVSLTATVNSIAQGSPTRLNSAPAPVLINGAASLGYVPSSLPDWGGVAPLNVQNALDRIAAKITPIP
jgi:hypothetical protein